MQWCRTPRLCTAKTTGAKWQILVEYHTTGVELRTGTHKNRHAGFCQTNRIVSIPGLHRQGQPLNLHCNLDSKISWSTQSKAALRSRTIWPQYTNVLPVMLPLASATRTHARTDCHQPYSLLNSTVQNVQCLHVLYTLSVAKRFDEITDRTAFGVKISANVAYSKVSDISLKCHISNAKVVVNIAK